ncbi:LysR family transcriptional regulator [Bradyrhizobium sp. JYMT SZCCT0180]|uniref:LysR family transcriptional regulator n=1 Tax=Bradyrhizobium sp. JYMT SZCCT0180 TaxID=2807666 RepID=UPI001BA9ECD7|nr:LysR family transcriptional regulator [Bradyrhizobium sp. JYMT SZCCT0180]MBR1211722.1 LysR family transcriptional regulator [Bradyrhizobium sp. JYMT SZCCT0180]
MDLDAKPYRCFLAVAEHGSFGRAAAVMNMSQPALSALIKEFERRLGFDLFARTSRRVELTAQGQLFLGNAQRIVTETNFARRMAGDISANQLLIGATYYTAIIAERIALTDGHLRDNPDIPTRISVRTQRAVYDDLQQKRLELAIVLEHEATPSQQSMFVNEIPSEGIERLVLRRRPVRLLTPQEDALAGLTSIPLARLAGERIAIINRSHGVSLSEAVIQKLTQAQAVLVRPPEGNALAVERYGALMRMSAVTLGWFDDQPVRANDRMVARDIEGMDIATMLVLARGVQPPRPAAEAFWRAAKAATVESATMPSTGRHT